MDGSGILNWGGATYWQTVGQLSISGPNSLKCWRIGGGAWPLAPPWIRPWLTDKIRRWRGGEGVGQWWQLQPVHWKEKYRQPFHNKIPNGDKILDQLKYQQKKISLELQRRRSFVLNPLVDLVLHGLYGKFFSFHFSHFGVMETCNIKKSRFSKKIFIVLGLGPQWP